MCGALRSGLSSAGHSPDADPVDLAADRDHRLAEPVELGEVLALGGLDHQRAGHREGHRRGVEAVVDQPLGDVVDADAGLLGQRPQVDDALVRDQAAGAGVEHGEVRFEPLGHVVRAEHGDLGGALEALGAHQPDVRPGDRQDARGAPGRGRDRADAGRRARGGLERVVGQVRRQVGAHRDRADARAAAAVRDAEGLVQVQVRDVGAEPAGPGQADQRVEVGAVDVDLAAGVVHGRADVGDVAPRTRRAWTGR